MVSGAAVRAAVTVTFHAAKPGLWINPGKSHAGEVHTIDIGIPRGAPADATIGLIDSAVRELLPRRGAASTKFASGQVVVAGGSRGLAGAPQMAARASMRAGAGYVIACVPAVAAGRDRRRGNARADDARPAPSRTAALTRDGGRRRCCEASGPAGRSRSARASGAATASVAFARELAGAARRRRWCSTQTA